VPPVADGPDLAAAEENLGRAEAAVDAAQHREVDDPGEDILSGDNEAEASHGDDGLFDDDVVNAVWVAGDDETETDNEGGPVQVVREDRVLGELDEDEVHNGWDSADNMRRRRCCTGGACVNAGGAAVVPGAVPQRY
jgi:hypothetical protein